MLSHGEQITIDRPARFGLHKSRLRFLMSQRRYEEAP
jgi:hypothetical protein